MDINKLRNKYPNCVTDVQVVSDTGSAVSLHGGVNPNWLGSNLGYGTLVAKLGHIDTSKFETFDNTLHKIKTKYDITSPVGNHIYRLSLIVNLRHNDRNYLMSYDVEDTFGTIGNDGLVEIAECNGEHYVIICAGSMLLGTDVYKHYKQITEQTCYKDYQNIVKLLKKTVQSQYIQQFLDLYKEAKIKSNDVVLTGQNLIGYQRDASLCDSFAWYNRIYILSIIESVFGVNADIVSHHSYNSLENCNDSKYILYKDTVCVTDDDLYSINTRVATFIGKHIQNSGVKYAPYSMGQSIDDIKGQLKDTFEITAVLKPIYSFCVYDK